LELKDLIPCEIMERINRFVVKIKLVDRTEMAHLRNTGRLNGLVERGKYALCIPKSKGKTNFLLIGVKVNESYALIDTKIQCLAFEHAIENNLIPWLIGWKIKEKEKTFLDSRIDYVLVKQTGDSALLEIKSAVDFDGYYSMYPDCPTDRGLKHLRTLTYARKKGMACFIVFIAAHPLAKAFKPNSQADPRIKKALIQAKNAGCVIRSIKFHLEKNGKVLLDNPSLDVVL
jgi:sugar fermentation stimulation protein